MVIIEKIANGYIIKHYDRYPVEDKLEDSCEVWVIEEIEWEEIEAGVRMLRQINDLIWPTADKFSEKTIDIQLAP